MQRGEFADSVAPVVGACRAAVSARCIVQAPGWCVVFVGELTVPPFRSVVDRERPVSGAWRRSQGDHICVEPLGRLCSRQ